MTNEDIKDMVDEVEAYVDRVNVDEITGRLSSLGIKIEKDNDVEAILETALIVAYSEEKKDD